GETITMEETVVVENENTKVSEEERVIEGEKQGTEEDVNEETNAEVEGDVEEVNKGKDPETKVFNKHRSGILPNIAPRALSSFGGDVEIDKKATPSGNFLEWDVELEVSGEDIVQETYDIVLVFDRSNSMNAGNREASSKAAAKQFADNLLGGNNDNIRIGVVPFGSDTSGNSNTGRINLTDNAQAVKNAINSIIIGPSYQDGGTHISAGLARGKTMLAGSGADNQIIVLFSDGEPTYSYEAGDYDKPYSGWTDGSNRYDYILKNFGSTVGNGLAGNTPSYNLGTPTPPNCGGWFQPSCSYPVEVRDHIIPTISHAHQEIM